MSRLKRESASISISEFYENHLLNKYNYDPVYQRKSVWTDEKRAFLIDSILKNFPIPPIFLHQKIDEDTGKTSFDIVDGKQRLTALTMFIRNELAVSSELDQNDEISGLLFSEIEGNLSEYKKAFWRYRIPIELIDSDDSSLIDEIFDRLNRNGEKLNGQELRKAKYYNTPLLKLVEKIANTNPFWIKRLETATDRNRMEDHEFISELIFVIAEDKLFGSNQETIDQKYETYSVKTSEWVDRIEPQFNKATAALERLNLKYEDLRITGVSHLFGLWSFVVDQMGKNNRALPKRKINNFYKILRSDPTSNQYVLEYKKSMSSGTKEVTQRNRRRQALIDYVEN
ncbi:DUF262 domain-containing protein [Pseudomonas sp. B6002]|uniref:DUF262 domain-containing protein n=1 Tax=Pseudomonas sp. B6002 TaxID=2726978 RepID=UPI00159FD1D0|nr:DUF262 domain-containing protein [Pseudomonas sp. B6002]NVZ52930.1 DUF262 domain-containing protein [Pseudomonas sp. B6002]